MKSLQFSTGGAKIIIESTGNPGWFRGIINTKDSFRCFSFAAMNATCAIYHMQLTLLNGGR